jgi:multiple sugar transport system substrate-binding protein
MRFVGKTKRLARGSVLGAVAIMSALTTNAFAKDFNWRQKEGAEIDIDFSAHSMSDALVSMLPEFGKKTGIKVKYQVAQENDFRAKLNAQLASGDSSVDIFMTGPSTNWEYSAGKWIEDLQPYVDNPELTAADWDFADLFQSAVNVNRWTGEEFGGLGRGPLYAIPMNEEGYSLAYRKDVLDRAGLKAPETVDELVADAAKLNGYEINGKKLDGFVARGQEFWPTLITGYGTVLAAYGAKDLNADGTSAAASPESIEATKRWVALLKSGPSDIASYGWEQAQASFAAGNAVFLLDADHMAEVFENPKKSQVAGKVGYALEPSGPAGRGSGIWLWSLGMNAYSKNKEAAWLFIEWASSKEIMAMTVPFGNINPTRKSVANGPEMTRFVANWGDYNKIWAENLDKYASWRWNPSTGFSEAGNRWALAAQEAFVLGKDPADTLKEAAKDINVVMDRARANAK